MTLKQTNYTFFTGKLFGIALQRCKNKQMQARTTIHPTEITQGKITKPRPLELNTRQSETAIKAKSENG